MAISEGTPTGARSQMQEQELPIVQITPLREDSGAVKSSITEAVRVAGLVDSGVRFELEHAEELGNVPAVRKDDPSPPSEPLERKILSESGSTQSVTFPHGVLDALGIDAESILEGDANPKLIVAAGDGVLAFQPADEMTVRVERDAHL